MADDYRVTIPGLRAFRRDLARLDKDLRREMDRDLRGAAQPIAADAKIRYRRLHQRRGRSKGSQRGIRASGGTRGAVVHLGAARFPYLQGQEFGSDRLARFTPRSGDSGRAGHFFYPAIRGGADRVLKDLEDRLGRLSRRAFPDRGR